MLPTLLAQSSGCQVVAIAPKQSRLAKEVDRFFKFLEYQPCSISTETKPAVPSTDRRITFSSAGGVSTTKAEIEGRIRTKKKGGGVRSSNTANLNIHSLGSTIRDRAAAARQAESQVHTSTFRRGKSPLAFDKSETRRQSQLETSPVVRCWTPRRGRCLLHWPAWRKTPASRKIPRIPTGSLGVSQSAVTAVSNHVV